MVGVNLPRTPVSRNNYYSPNFANNYNYMSEDPLRQHLIHNSVHQTGADYERHVGHAIASNGGASNSYAPYPAPHAPPVGSQNAHTNSVEGETSCAKMPGLVGKQLQVCEGHPNAMYAVSEGAKRAIQECQKQFKNERWNCTTEGDKSVFGHTLQRGLCLQTLHSVWGSIGGSQQHCLALKARICWGKQSTLRI